MGIEPLDAFSLPLLNTVILLSSGVSITLSHRALACGDLEYTSLGLIITLFYGLIFTLIQVFEYNTAGFAINDGVFGSIFYLCTGFHGFHVFVGSLFLAVCLGRNLRKHFTASHHVGFLCAAYY
jgi:cytochrome c oxidase subunit 3